MTDKVYHYHEETTELGEETIKRVLRNSGLTEKEAEVYIFLSQHDIRKGTEIAQLLKKDKAQVFRILRRLQTKGFVEATLEFPSRFTVVPFENILSSLVRAKQEEVAFIKGAKKELLDYLSKKQQVEPPEKLVVIKGNKKIYQKISQIIGDAKTGLSVATTVPSLIVGDRLGVFESAFNRTPRAEIQYRFLIDSFPENQKAAKALVKRISETGNLRARNPELGLNPFPRIVIRDGEEILFFISKLDVADKVGKEEVCLWTNSKPLVQAFTSVFEDLWLNATDIKTRISEAETGIQATSKTCVIKDTETARQKYNGSIQAAEKEIIMITSLTKPVEFMKNMQLLKHWNEKGVSVKMMVPITRENIEAVQQLSKHQEVRHVPVGYLATTIVDGKDLFSFKTSSYQEGQSEQDFESTFYTNDSEYVTRTKNMLNDIWKNARAPSTITLGSTIPSPQPVAPLPDDVDPLVRPDSPYQKMVVKVAEKTGLVTEKDVLNKIITAKKIPGKNWPKQALRFYGNAGHAVIHPPESFNLPDFLVRAVHENKQSSFGTTDRLYVYLWLKTQKGYSYVPVASVSDNPEDAKFQKTLLARTPAEQNIQVFQKDALQLRFQGNTFFAGWTKPIPLMPSKYTLPPACILLESYNELRTRATEFTYPSGVKANVEVNGYDAFVTFFHPASKYSGPGTDGVIGRDVVATMHPPRRTIKASNFNA